MQYRTYRRVGWLRFDWPMWIVGTVVAGVLALCGWVIYHELTEIKSGVVTKKEFHPAYLTQQCSTVNNVTTCTPVWHAECYYVRYEANGEWGDACVTALEYDRLRVGSYYPDGSER